jgi:hypothetical protein
VSVARDEASFFQQDQHGSHRAGIGGHASSQFTLSERMASRERRQEYELIGGHAKFCKLHVRAAMESQVGSP